MNLIRRIVLFLTLVCVPLIAAAAPVDLNTADAKTLAALDGIGPQKAQAIIAYRQEHGPFKSVDDLLKVKGIGKKTLDANRGKIIVGTGTGSGSDNPVTQ